MDGREEGNGKCQGGTEASGWYRSKAEEKVTEQNKNHTVNRGGRLQYNSRKVATLS